MTSNDKKYYQGLGRRKSSIARIRLFKGNGKATINGKEIAKPKKGEMDFIWLEPMIAVSAQDKLDISIKVLGGGIIAQKDAIRLGIARALVVYDEKNKSVLRKLGFLTRDPREKERKKPGLKRARRAPQWRKR